MLRSITNNFFSPEQLTQVWSQFEYKPQWKYHLMAGGAYFWQYVIFEDMATHLKHPEKWDWENHDPIWKELLDQVCAEAEEGFKPCRFIINGQTLGQQGMKHTDFDPWASKRTSTFLCYLNKEWEPDWGGETIFFDHRTNEPFETVIPEPGKMVHYEGMIPHLANPPTVPNVLRVTLAVQGEYS